MWLMICELGLDAFSLLKFQAKETLQLANKALLAEQCKQDFTVPKSGFLVLAQLAVTMPLFRVA